MSKDSQKNKNALRHGLYASDIVLPWEKEADFTALLEEFMKEYLPQGPTEHELVIDIARLRWLKRRLMRSSQRSFHEEEIATRNGNVVKSGLVESQKNIKAEARKEDEIRQNLKKFVELHKALRDKLASAGADTKQGHDGKRSSACGGKISAGNQFCP